jgi:hypothetical protein
MLIRIQQNQHRGSPRQWKRVVLRRRRDIIAQPRNGGLHHGGIDQFLVSSLSRHEGGEGFFCVTTYRMRGLKSSHCLSGRRPFLKSPAHSFVFSPGSQK